MRVSIVTPVLNAPRFLAGAIGSVMGQVGGFTLDYQIVDGGSDQETLDVIRRCAKPGMRWNSGPDKGMYDAIAKGFGQSDGDIMGWLNADDALLPGTLDLVTRIFTDLPEAQWLTSLTPMSIDEAGDVRAVRNLPGLARDAFLDGVYVGMGGLGDSHASDFIQQESTFWRRSLWEQSGAADWLPNYRLAGDFALWAAFFDQAPPLGVAAPMGLFRLHGGQLSRSRASAYLGEANAALGDIRQRAGRARQPARHDDTRYYSGDFAEKNASGRWIREKRDFAVLPASPLKQALGQGRVF